MNTISREALAQAAGPKYKAVAATIRKAIAEGQLPAGARLPPVRDLAYQLGITPGTVARAYTILTDEGVLEAAVGRGTFVSKPDKTNLAPIGPIEVDTIPHRAEGMAAPISLFSPALPNVGQAELIRDLLTEIAIDPPSGVMHYPNRAAFLPARVAVLRWLDGAPLGPVDASDVVLSHGGQNGILLVLQALLRGRRPVVLVEELNYPGFRRAAELQRADVVPVAMDQHGISPEALEEAVRAHDAQVLCTSPEVHNPTGIFTPADRREALVAVARRYDLHFLEDDCYRVGRAQAPSYRMLAPERGWFVTSISKTLTPALRLGFAIAPHGKVAALRRAAEHGFFGMSTPIADLASKLLAHPDVTGLADKVRAVLNSYIRVAVNHLGIYDLTWRTDVPFLWLQLPPGWRASSFCQAAEAAGVRIRPAEEFACRDARTPHAVRIGINAQVSPADFEDAMIRLRDLLANPPERIGV